MNYNMFEYSYSLNKIVQWLEQNNFKFKTKKVHCTNPLYVTQDVMLYCMVNTT